jgi:hypothetical protein
MSRHTQKEIFEALRRRELFRKWTLVALAIIFVSASIYAIAFLARKQVRPLPTEGREASGNTTASSLGGGNKVELTASTAKESSRIKPLSQVETQERFASVRTTIEGFLAATSNEDRLKWIRMPSQIRPYLEEYYNRPAALKPEFGSLGEVFPIEEAGLSLVAGRVTFANGVVNDVILEWNGSAFLLDWESFVNYSTLSWKDFQTVRSRNPVAFRVLATKGDFYFPPFSDMDKWGCLALQHSVEDGILYAYFDLASPESTLLRDLVQNDEGKEIPIMVELQYPEEPGRINQVVLRRIIGKGWIRQIR